MPAIAIEAGVEMPVVSGTASPGYAAAVNRAANADIRPWSGSPISIHRTSANPSDASFRAEPNVRYRSPGVNSEFSRLGWKSTQT
jgi:hypothetical protein